MIDMCNTFPYFLVKNEKVETEVPSIICPSEDGSYYKDEWLGHKTPKRFIHVAMMQSLGGDRNGFLFSMTLFIYLSKNNKNNASKRFVWPDEPIMEWIDFGDFVKKLAKPEIYCTEAGVPLFFEFDI